MMDSTLKAKWVDALRNGGYSQTRRVLRNADGAYCCLGVLCVVADVEIAEDGEGVADTNNYAPIHALLGRPAVPQQNQSDDLWRLNDAEGKTFAEIADYIEGNSYL